MSGCSYRLLTTWLTCNVNPPRSDGGSSGLLLCMGSLRVRGQGGDRLPLCASPMKFRSRANQEGGGGGVGWGGESVHRFKSAPARAAEFISNLLAPLTVQIETSSGSRRGDSVIYWGGTAAPPHLEHDCRVNLKVTENLQDSELITGVSSKEEAGKVCVCVCGERGGLSGAGSAGETLAFCGGKLWRASVCVRACVRAHPSPLPGLCWARWAYSESSARGSVRTPWPALLSLLYLIYLNLCGVSANKSAA